MTDPSLEQPNQVLISAARELAIIATFDRDADLIADMRWRWRIIGRVLDLFEKEKLAQTPGGPDKQLPGAKGPT